MGRGRDLLPTLILSTRIISFIILFPPQPMVKESMNNGIQVGDLLYWPEDKLIVTVVEIYGKNFIQVCLDNGERCNLQAAGWAKKQYKMLRKEVLNHQK